MIIFHDRCLGNNAEEENISCLTCQQAHGLIREVQKRRLGINISTVEAGERFVEEVSLAEDSCESCVFSVGWAKKGRKEGLMVLLFFLDDVG